MKTTTLAFLAATILLAAPPTVSAAKPKGDAINPDFIKGESIPEGFKHDWNLGATGAVAGWFPTSW
jgi:hypothetical protein